MGRMHSGKKGKSGSKKPIKKSNPSWLTYKPKEIEQLIIKLAKSGNSSSKIGLVLRDTYGIPDAKVALGKSILKVMKEKKLVKDLPEDLSALIRRHITLTKHMEANRKDFKAKRGVQLTESKIKRLVKYYKKSKALPQNWIFERSKAKLLVE
ncbi:MAG: 30S ribosomal protein S15 [Candidatus Woesearchaeota archaeon]